jgi:hypothetical protein
MIAHDHSWMINPVSLVSAPTPQLLDGVIL